ncbi:MAG: ATP-binding protein [Bacteroidetes bacterium]|nr:ATP-binding protein [Bacteroidota bacterium]
MKSYIESIFYNLISNAIKYRSNEGKHHIVISTKKEKNIFHFTISDNGKGIDLEKNGKYIFGLYKRFHSEVEGKGLGLHMVKTQVEALGGHISVESEVEKGTTFKITLPCHL